MIFVLFDCVKTNADFSAVCTLICDICWRIWFSLLLTSF
jgi:hypothetical protein